MSITSRSQRNSSVGKDLEEPWTCEDCNKVFSDPDAKLLECQRCKNHFCIRCLKKSKNEYDVLSRSDTMWFCTKCKPNVEENIATGFNIESMCNKILLMFESRIKAVEDQVQNKCDESRVRDIVQDEISKVQNSATQESLTSNIESKSKVEVTNCVMDEIQERKMREKNIIIFGLPECDSENKQERDKHDQDEIKEIFAASKIRLDIEEPIKTSRRLGKYDNTKPSRPLVATLDSVEQKVLLFKNFYYAKQHEKYKKMSISNDLTQTEREQEKKLWNEAKKQQESDRSGDYMYKVRGPPWARRIVKIKK